MRLPGGGDLKVLYESTRLTAAPTLVVLEQRRADKTYRWLCSRSGGGRDAGDEGEGDEELLAETIVECSPEVASRTRQEPAARFDRSSLLPQYHAGMVAALGLRPRAAPRLRSFLFLGVGGGALCLFLAQQHPHVTMTGVESDPRVLDLAGRFFGLRAGPRLRLHCLSATAFLERYPTGRYDAIYVDATDGSGRDGTLRAPHASLCSRRALRLLCRRLRPGGVLALNVLGEASAAEQLERRLAAALTDGQLPRNRTADTPPRCWSIATGEGNRVLAAVARLGPGSAGDEGCGGGGDGDGDGGGAAFRAACETLALRCRRIEQK